MRDGCFYKFWVYIIGSRTGTLYTGMTGFLETRITQHKSGSIEGFTKRYGCKRLVYYEVYSDVGCCQAPRKATEGLATGEKDSPHRENESPLGRLGRTLGERNAF